MSGMASAGLLVVTGANGFLGSEVVRQARFAGIPVRATDRGTGSPVTGVEYRQGNILEHRFLAGLMDGARSVIHTAGLAHILGNSDALASAFRDVNENGTANVASAAVAAGIDHLVVVSSVAVYGTSGSREESPCKPLGPYAESKWRAEQRARQITMGSDAILTVLRMATIYGEGDPGNVARLVQTIDSGRFIWIGSGTNRKSLIYREDAARACIIALGRRREDHGIYNVSGHPSTMRAIVDAIAQALEKRISRLFLPGCIALQLSGLAARLSRGFGRGQVWHDMMKKWLADEVYEGTRFHQSFDFRTRIGLQEGLRREVSWYRNQVKALRAPLPPNRRKSDFSR